MPRYVIRLVIFVLISVLLSAASAMGTGTLTALWKESRQGGEYIAATQEDVHRARELFGRLLQGEGPSELAFSWQQLGFIINDQKFRNKRYHILREMPEMLQGRGLFLFAPGSRNDNMLMIPHGYKDVGTGLIGLRLFQQHDFAAIAFNTVPRYQESDNGKLQVHDMGKMASTYFTSLSRAFGEVEHGGKLIQLHGFAREKRTSSAGRDAGVIISGGSRKVRQDILQLKACLQGVFSENVLVYPTEVEELGGTTNISGQILRSMDHDGFVHVEINRDIRDKLRNDRALRKNFGNCLEKL